MLAINSDWSWWRMKHYTMHFTMLQCTIPQPRNETQCLYETSCNLRQYGMYLCTCMSMCICACGYVRMWICVCVWPCECVCMCFAWLWLWFCMMIEYTREYFIVNYIIIWLCMHVCNCVSMCAWLWFLCRINYSCNLLHNLLNQAHLVS